ncbi:MAG: hypothetical protein ACPGC5_06500, partial [Flavobacteriaceae bacterium]
MKKFTYICLLVFTQIFFFNHSYLFAQVDPCDYGVEGFNYQAIITDLDGNIVQNRPVQLKFQIQQYSAGELRTVYEESHAFTVADNGVVNLILGQGQPQSNSRFCEIHWEVGPTYLTRLIDLGDGFFEGGQTVFNSVPVAEFAKNAGQIPGLELYYNTVVGEGSYAAMDVTNSAVLGAQAVVASDNTIQLGNAAIELVNTSGTVSASAFKGDGSELTGINAGQIPGLELYYNTVVGEG